MKSTNSKKTTLSHQSLAANNSQRGCHTFLWDHSQQQGWLERGNSETGRQLLDDASSGVYGMLQHPQFS